MRPERRSLLPRGAGDGAVGTGLRGQGRGPSLRAPSRAQMSFPQSGHRMSSRSVRKPRPTSDREHFLQLKQSLCHCRSSKEMYLVPPRPVCGGEGRGEHSGLGAGAAPGGFGSVPGSGSRHGPRHQDSKRNS